MINFLVGIFALVVAPIFIVYKLISTLGEWTREYLGRDKNGSLPKDA